MSCIVSYEETLFNDIQIDHRTLPVQIVKGVRYKYLRLLDYLRVYKYSIQDGYRTEARGKTDTQKIALIKKLLTEEK